MQLRDFAWSKGNARALRHHVLLRGEASVYSASGATASKLVIEALGLFSIRNAFVPRRALILELS